MSKKKKTKLPLIHVTIEASRQQIIIKATWDSTFNIRFHIYRQEPKMALYYKSKPTLSKKRVKQLRWLYAEAQKKGGTDPLNTANILAETLQKRWSKSMFFRKLNKLYLNKN